MAVIDWRPIIKKYAGLWVGLKDDEMTVIVSGKTPREVMEKAQKKGFSKPILLHVPTKVIPFVGGLQATG